MGAKEKQRFRDEVALAHLNTNEDRTFGSGFVDSEEIDASQPLKRAIEA